MISQILKDYRAIIKSYEIYKFLYSFRFHFRLEIETKTSGTFLCTRA